MRCRLAWRPQWQVRFTLTLEWWIHQVEGGFAELTRKQLQLVALRSSSQFEVDLRAFIDNHNRAPKPF